ncbi:MAG: DUF4386 domain-containing protein [Terracidiphilus sp.]|jgi:hypothetical protein
MPNSGITLRQAALTAGFAYLLNPVSYAEAALFPKLVIPGNIEQTVQNISTHSGAFVAVIFCYFINFVGDIVIAWSLYFLLAPVNKSLSLLASLFQLVYTAIGFFAMLSLVNAFHLLTTPYYLTVFEPGPLHAQVQFQLNSFRTDWSMGFILFAIHLVLLGYLIFRSGYIPRIIGIILVIDGLGWIIDCLQPYLYPSAHLGFLFFTFLGELVFMLWLLIRGWKIQEPAPEMQLR